MNALAVSIAAYSANPDRYAANRSTSAADLFLRFASLLAPGSLVLDAGCGPGRDLARFRAAGHTAVGVDLCPQFSPQVLADLRALPFPAALFDAAWACASLVHLTDADTVLALSELARVTRGGPVMACVKGDRPAGWRTDDLGPRWYNSWTPGRLTRAGEAAGLLGSAVHHDPVWVELWAVAS